MNEGNSRIHRTDGLNYRFLNQDLDLGMTPIKV